MAINERGHTVPAPTGEAPTRAGIFGVFPTINDVLLCASVADRTAKIAALSYAPSPSRPAIFWRADAAAGAQLEAWDGTQITVYQTGINDKTWTALTANGDWTAGTGSNAPQVMRQGNLCFYRGAFSGGTASAATVLPTWARPFDRDIALTMSNQATGANDQMLVRTNGEMRPRQVASTSTIVNVHGSVALCWSVL